MESPIRGRNQVYLLLYIFFTNKIDNVYKMSTIIWNKLLLHVLFLEKYQIKFLDKHAYIQNKILVVGNNAHHSGTYRGAHYNETYKSG